MAYFARYMLGESGNLRKVVINAGVGFVLPFYGETAPPGTLACDGSEISRTVYDELFQVLGTKAGAGDGVNTFNLPDFRGDFIRGLGGDNAGELGVEQGDAIRNIEDNLSYRAVNGTDGLFNVETSQMFSQHKNSNKTARSIAYIGTTDNAMWDLDIDVSRAVPTAAENRPVNVALLWCIIYE